MATKLIELEDGTFVEIEAQVDEIQQIAGGVAKKVSATFENIKPILTKAYHPIIAAVRELNQDMNIDQAEVELGLSFEGEGNLYVTKAKSSANLTVKLILKPDSLPDTFKETKQNVTK